ncbi:hypothetical protein BUH_5217 [Burkholderia pseudomallei Pakistan 9]|nr:hypothetical protein BUH_5217 [Burkholderia pseudomallei Pakistan 9]
MTVARGGAARDVLRRRRTPTCDVGKRGKRAAPTRAPLGAGNSPPAAIANGDSDRPRRRQANRAAPHRDERFASSWTPPFQRMAPHRLGVRYMRCAVSDGASHDACMRAPIARRV